MQFSRKRWLCVLTLAAVCAAPAGAAPVAAEPPGGRFQATRWLVNDAEMVVIVNVRQMLDSALMKKDAIARLKALLANDAKAKGVIEATGVDPLQDIEAIVVSGSAPSGRDVKPQDVKAQAVVRGKFDRTRIHGAAEKFAKKHPDELKILAREGGVQLYEIKADKQALFAAFADNATLVVTPSREATVEAVKNAGRGPARVNKDLQAVLPKFSGKESMTLVLVVNEEMKKAIGKMPQVADVASKLETVTGTVNLTDAATTSLAVNTTDAKVAEKLLQVFNQVKTLGEVLAPNMEELGPFAGEVLKAMKLATNSKSVTLDLKVTPEMIEKAGKKEK